MKTKLQHSLLTAAILASSVTMSGTSHAALLDDFNFTTSGAATDVDSTDGIGVLGSRGTGGTVLTGWSRGELYANLVAGDGVSTQDCANCGEGHFVNNANSTGNGYWSWTSDSGVQDISNSTWDFLYGVDVSGVDLILSFFDSTTNTVTGQIEWQDAAAGGIPGTGLSFSGSVGAGVLADTIFLDAFSVGDVFNPLADGVNYNSVVTQRDFGNAAFQADINIDQAVPEPATWALMGLGLAGLRWKRRPLK